MKTDNSWKRQAVSKTASIKEWFYWWWPPTVPLSCSCWEEKPWDGPGHRGSGGSHRRTSSTAGLLQNDLQQVNPQKWEEWDLLQLTMLSDWPLVLCISPRTSSYHICAQRITYMHRQQRGTYRTRLWSKSDQPVISCFWFSLIKIPSLESSGLMVWASLVHNCVFKELPQGFFLIFKSSL